MQQKISAFDIEIELAPSKALIAIAVVITLLAVTAIWVLHSHMLIKILLIICLCFASFFTLRGLALLSGEAVVALRSVIAEKAWILKSRNGFHRKAIQDDCRVFTHLVMLSVKDAQGRRKTILVSSDALAAQKHRQLRAVVLSMRELSND